MSKRSQQIDAFFRQGQQFHIAGRLAEAEQIYRQVIAAAPRQRMRCMLWVRWRCKPVVQPWPTPC